MVSYFDPVTEQFTRTKALDVHVEGPTARDVSCHANSIEPAVGLENVSGDPMGHTGAVAVIRSDERVGQV